MRGTNKHRELLFKAFDNHPFVDRYLGGSDSFHDLDLHLFFLINKRVPFSTSVDKGNNHYNQYSRLNIIQLFSLKSELLEIIFLTTFNTSPLLPLHTMR